MLTAQEEAALAAIGPHAVRFVELRRCFPAWGASEVRRVVYSLTGMGKVRRDALGRVRRVA